MRAVPQAMARTPGLATPGKVNLDLDRHLSKGFAPPAGAKLEERGDHSGLPPGRRRTAGAAGRKCRD